MTTFDDLFLARAMPALMDMFGESEAIVYRPLGGLPRSLAAIVDRTPPEAVSAVPGQVLPRLVVTVFNQRSNDPALDGILSSELNTGGDLVEISVRKGGTPETLAINRLRADDGGATVFEVR